jgi:hypothetical protein
MNATGCLNTIKPEILLEYVRVRDYLVQTGIGVRRIILK